MPALRTNVQIVRKFAVKQHGAAFIAFGPQVFWHLATRKNRIDARADVVVDPVHYLIP
jgi:hypothetical protein